MFERQSGCMDPDRNFQSAGLVLFVCLFALLLFLAGRVLEGCLTPAGVAVESF